MTAKTDCRTCKHFQMIHPDWMGFCQWEPDALPDLPHPPIRGEVRATASKETVNVYVGSVDPTVTNCPVWSPIPA